MTKDVAVLKHNDRGKTAKTLDLFLIDFCCCRSNVILYKYLEGVVFRVTQDSRLRDSLRTKVPSQLFYSVFMNVRHAAAAARDT
jgi:hypothetical protein